MGNRRYFPSQSQIQEWILAIRPYSYFESMVESPGLLVLRAKEPPCIYQGIHIALSDQKRSELIHDLQQFDDSLVIELEYHSSHPEGRAWFELFTSGINFGNKSVLSFKVDDSINLSEIRVRFRQHFVSFRLNSHALATLISELGQSPDGGIKSSLKIIREEKPLAEPHNLWFWLWGNHEIVS